MARRILNSLLCLILIVTLFPSTIFGAGGGAGNDGTSGTGQLGLQFLIESGNLHYEALNTTATTGIRYVSVAWILRADRTCDDDPSNPKPNTAQCSPTKDNKYVELDFDSLINAGKMKSKDIVGYQPGKTLTVYDMNAELIQEYMANQKELSGIKEGDPLYFSAVFKVKRGNTPVH